MNQKLILTTIFCLYLGISWTQNCPPSTDGKVHIVQNGETLFSISRKYNISVDNLRKWNNMKPTDVLLVCAKINLVDGEGKIPKTEMPASGGNPRNETVTGFVIPTNDVHVVKQGETVAGIARKYGYTEERLRVMNNLQSNQVVKPGQELLVSGCGLCGKGSTTVSNTGVTPYKPTSEKPVSGKPVISTTGVTPGSYEEADINKLIELNESYDGNSSFPKVVHVVSQGESLGLIAQLYGMSEAEIMKMNGLQKGNQIFENQKLLVEDRKDGKWEPIHTSEYPDPSAVSNSPSSNPDSYLPPVSTEPTVEVEEDPQPVAQSGSSSAMTAVELSMLDEINLLRKNPSAYIPYIDAYIKEMQVKNNTSAVKSAKELIVELRGTGNLSKLEAKECIYVAAVKHGEEQRSRGSLNHDGLDGTWPWDRVMRECPEIQDGNENLIGGPVDVRKIVILLLVDDGIDSRGHRKILLNPDWKYAACYKIGQVGEMQNCWVQDFGY